MAGTVKALWVDYLFLTREMAKFLDRRDFDMFDEIMKQRENVQTNIDAAADNEFAGSQEGRQLLLQVKQQEELIKVKLSLLLNSAKQEQTVSQAYDPYTASANIGYRMDRQS